MTTKTSDIPVRLDELAGHLGGQDAEQWVREVGGEIEQDWLGRKVTSPATARKALEACNKRAAESARLASEFDAYQADWERRYVAVGEEAYRSAAERQLEVEQQALRDMRHVLDRPSANRLPTWPSRCSASLQRGQGAMGETKSSAGLRGVGSEEPEEAMRERTDFGRNDDRIYEAFRGAVRRFGESRIESRTMANGRKIYYPASGNGPERRTRLEERECRLREIERSL
jgi:hypothetical protein